MNCLSLFIFISLLTLINSAYNPIPIGAVIISTVSQIFVMQPKEYGGDDSLNIIYTATNNMSIINSVYDPSLRNLYILFTIPTSSNIYLCQLMSLETLSSTIYTLPVTFNITNINQLNSFTSDIINRRVFLTDQTGAMTLFSMSGLMNISINKPANMTDQVRSIAYDNTYNSIYIITDTKVNNCTNFNNNSLQCCEGLARGNLLRSIGFDVVSGQSITYVLDANSGIYQVAFDTNGCPTALHPINTLGTFQNLYFAIDRGLYFASGTEQGALANSILIIANGTQATRTVPVRFTIVALHVSKPPTTSTAPTEETCFHGITYGTYRAAVILAAIFGTIMGIFMCFNALFCIDFFMTKRIIRGLKQQIPHSLLEDRWNRLVEEKYAKIALEKQRKKDDPPPAPRRSSISGRKKSSLTAGDARTSNPATEESTSRTDSLTVSNPIPKISSYIRRKSDSYFNRRQSDDYRGGHYQASAHFPGNDASPNPRSNPQRTTVTAAPQIHIERVEEEHDGHGKLRSNLSRRELLKDDAEFL
ncbi:unnamed protein product [Adineta steineri]|uniref:Uncharacterized protein n=1 Tax=Adineta steineri TaxID=433720 RepID=A0A814D503_9BILA|nr:unnamed protein product [Adineta steineri]CAF1028665.1 unnamed protein product [Adineta steineri]CAF1389340.1 unnamed protein product [Adineta steineri]